MSCLVGTYGVHTSMVWAWCGTSCFTSVSVCALPRRRNNTQTCWFWSFTRPTSRLLLVQLARQFPDIGQVKVDRMGNIIGGVNPFEGMDAKLEDQPNPADQEVGAPLEQNEMPRDLLHVA